MQISIIALCYSRPKLSKEEVPLSLRSSPTGPSRREPCSRRSPGNPGATREDNHRKCLFCITIMKMQMHDIMHNVLPFCFANDLQEYHCLNSFFRKFCGNFLRNSPRCYRSRSSENQVFILVPQHSRVHRLVCAIRLAVVSRRLH